MGWYDVAAALRDNDEEELARALAHETDPERTLYVAMNQLEKEREHVPDDICFCPVHEGYTNEEIEAQG